MNMNLYNSWLEINLDDLTNNVKQVRSIINPECVVMAVIKSNAYGHGALEIARHLENNCNINYFAVANIWEALELRESNINSSILVLGGLVSGEQLEEAVKNHITITLFDINTAKKIAEVANKLGKVSKIHIKIDSGLRRIGFRPGDELQEFLMQLKEIDGLEIEGAFSHFSESGSLDKTFTLEQLDIFKKGLEQLKSNGIEPKYIHCAASQAILELPQSHFNLVRAGKLIYGYHGMDHEYNGISIKPILKWKAIISNITKVYKGESIGYSRSFIANKDMIIAVVAVGFGDGYSSLLSNEGSVIISGIKRPIVGRVCMDSCFIDITNLEDIHIGDVVTVLGEDGNMKITKEEICAISKVQVSEVIANIGRRVCRVYTKREIR